MKYLILGHKQHGKDTAADLLRDAFGVTFMSSSLFCLERAVWPALIEAGLSYPSLEAAYADRDNHRIIWRDAISQYNSPDKAKLVKELLSCSDMYVGMRCHLELEASKHLFHQIFWIHRPGLPTDESMTIEYDPDFMIPIVNAGDRELMLHQLTKVLDI
jgi:hypothetical protein